MTNSFGRLSSLRFASSLLQQFFLTNFRIAGRILLLWWPITSPTNVIFYCPLPGVHLPGQPGASHGSNIYNDLYRDELAPGSSNFLAAFFSSSLTQRHRGVSNADLLYGLALQFSTACLENI